MALFASKWLVTVTASRSRRQWQSRGGRCAIFLHRFRLFSLFGFEVSIDASWLLLAVLIGWTLAGTPHSRPGVTSAVTRQESTELMGDEVSEKGALTI